MTPDELALRAARPGTPRAIVRSLALYLEPLYVARSSFLRADLESSARTVRDVARIESAVEENGETVTIGFPESADDRLPDPLRDVIRLEARIDRGGRLGSLEVDLRGAAPDGGPGRLALACTPSNDPGDPQPSRAVWTLPDGREVTIGTTFREQDGRRVPAERRIGFPSRYDPGETEEIRVAYGDYVFDGLPGDDDDAASFRFDENGLVDD